MSHKRLFHWLMKLIKPHLTRTLIRFVLMAAPLLTYAQTKRAFLVGISDYPQTDEQSWNNIHGANDVEVITKTLKAQSFKITSLTNKVATAKNIRKGLNDFTATCKLGDIIYLHFSCHGQPYEDLNGDEKDGWDEALIPFDAKKTYTKGKYEGENHITDDELNGYLKSIRSKVGLQGFVYVIIDACHAGSSYRGEEKEDSIFIRGTNMGFSASNRQYTPRIDKRGMIKIEKAANIASIYILEACRSYQVNTEIKENGRYYGPLSFYVNKILQDTKLIDNPSWTNKVVSLLNQDIRLIRQNVVIETSM